MREDMNAYGMMPEADQYLLKLVEIPEKRMTLRALNRTSAKEASYATSQFRCVAFLAPGTEGKGQA